MKLRAEADIEMKEDIIKIFCRMVLREIDHMREVIDRKMRCM